VVRPTGKAFMDRKFTEAKDKVERKHMPECVAETSKTWENGNLQKKCFDHHNKSKDVEYNVEKSMTQKARVKTLDGQRANLPMVSLGDKNYKAVDYEPGFFLAGGLIAGSTQQQK
jgi:hypothetical protein